MRVADMNLALEYLLRNKRIHDLLILPCSLFLNFKDNDNKLIITITTPYGVEGVVIKQWKMWLAEPTDKLPPFDEYVINRNDIFTSPNVKLDNCYLMDYAEEPFQTGGRQNSDNPEAAVQERQYRECLDNFYNTLAHRQKRQNWLWEAFEPIYLPDDLKLPHDHTEMGLRLQRELVNFYSKPIWKTWQYWCKHLLYSPKYAAELLFSADYDHKTKPVRFYSTF